MSISTTVLQLSLRKIWSLVTPFLRMELNANITDVPMMNTNLKKNTTTEFILYIDCIHLIQQKMSYFSIGNRIMLLDVYFFTPLHVTPVLDIPYCVC